MKICPKCNRQMASDTDGSGEHYCQFCKIIVDKYGGIQHV